MDSIKDIIPQVVGKMVRSRNQQAGEQGALEQIWQDILEKQQLRHTRLGGQRDGNLLVFVDSPARAYHLRMGKAKTLKQIREKMPEIKDITFKVSEQK
jgi:predicted nucleic acid-binding Zn ribbon protein